MRDVRGSGTGTGDGTAVPGTTTLGMPGFDPALLQAAQLDAGAQAAMKMGAIETVGEQLADATSGVQDASEALQAQDRSVTFQANVQAHVPTPLARMTPSALLETVLDESTKLEIEEAMKELHVELEPEDLGPVVVRLRKGPDGTLDIGFKAREGDAARVLEAGSELLRSRLFEAGFASVRIDVAHDEELQLTR
jgi:flagellar hook-length control protein FliK